ncbi:MAG: family 43 glycosylhydrolase [Bacteroidales bacterium]|nr:family 43 glycosylhydrolase [Bacteroidales bacterium]
MITRMTMPALAVMLTLSSALSCSNPGQTSGQQTYVNPIVHADYSDPDVIRVGDDFYMTASSFNCMPGLPILHSKDLVHWTIVNYALENYPVEGWNDRIQHGNGIWAPAIRHHDGHWYIYCGDPDRGIFMVRADDPKGKWSEPIWVVEAKGFIDPCPFWDEDGKAYLSHGCAGSRAGLKSVLFVAEMSADGTRLLSDSRVVYDGHATQPTIEGTKFYRKDGNYYIFSPAGGVPTGWQVVLRSDNPFGPYEERVVMAQGGSRVNGPHQGGWVDTPDGKDWFIHFQDKDAYGRILHLQPMNWTEDGWPVIGIDDDGDGVGNPVDEYVMPVSVTSCDCGAWPAGYAVADLSPEGIAKANSMLLPDLSWQWQADPGPYWFKPLPEAGESPADLMASPAFRLYSVEQPSGWESLADTPNLLLKKFSASDFEIMADMEFVPNPQLEEHGEEAGLVVMGLDYTVLKFVDKADGVRLVLARGRNVLWESEPLAGTDSGIPYSNRYMSTSVPPVPPIIYTSYSAVLKLSVRSQDREGNVPVPMCSFSWSSDGGQTFVGIPGTYPALQGRWIGAKVGVFCNRHAGKNDSGHVDIRWKEFRK